MTARCCKARRLSGAAASLLPSAVLVLLPKCPLCLAAWLTVFTGMAIPAATAASVRGLIVLLWVAIVARALRPPRRHSADALHILAPSREPLSPNSVPGERLFVRKKHVA